MFKHNEMPARPHGATRADTFELTFPHSDVMSGLVGPTVDRLMSLSDTPESCLEHQARVVFKFSGFDHDPRELHQIPECVSFFRAVHALWPYWFHFMAPQPDGMAILILLVCESTILRHGGLPVGGSVTDSQQAIAEFTHMVNAVENLHSNMNIPHSDTIGIVCGVIHSLGKATGK